MTRIVDALTLLKKQSYEMFKDLHGPDALRATPQQRDDRAKEIKRLTGILLKESQMKERGEVLNR